MSLLPRLLCFFFFFFNDTATTEIYTLSLHDALPISSREAMAGFLRCSRAAFRTMVRNQEPKRAGSRRLARLHRSEEHTSELQSLRHLVCRLLLEKKKK